MTAIKGIQLVFICCALSCVALAGNLDIEVMEDDALHGAFYTGNITDWYLKFSVEIDDGKIVSVCSIHVPSEDHDVDLTTLQIPYTNKDTRKIDDMSERVLTSAKAAVRVIENVKFLPSLEEIVDASWDMANSLKRKSTDLGDSQVRFAAMYHSTIISSALRVSLGAVEKDDICYPSPEYTSDKGTSLFVCSQDVVRNETALASVTNLYAILSDNTDHGRQKRALIRCSNIPIRGTTWGCCGNYPERCRCAHVVCLAHDAACTCCSFWWCFSGCRKDPWCP